MEKEVIKCDICHVEEATVDGKLKFGPWAFMCDRCHKLFGCGLGLGKGQLLKGESDEKRSQDI